MHQNRFLKGILGPPHPHRDPGPGPEGPWALRPKHLAGNSELLGSKLNEFYEGLASCRGVSETAAAP